MARNPSMEKMSLKTLDPEEHNNSELWTVEFHHDFYREFQDWSEPVQDALLSQTGKLRVMGPSLGRPSVDALKGSAYGNMKELRFEAESGVWRVAFSFDPERKAILLCGGSKTGVQSDRFYQVLLRIADKRYRGHLEQLKRKQRGLK